MCNTPTKDSLAQEAQDMGSITQGGEWGHVG